jgi:hypothetical protein
MKQAREREERKTRGKCDEASKRERRKKDKGV